MRNAPIHLSSLAISVAISTFANGQDSSVALPKFDAEVGALLRWNEERIAQNGEDGRAAVAHAAAFAKKLGEVKVEGLPEDLRAAFREYAAALGNLQSVIAMGSEYAMAESKEGRPNPENRADFKVKMRAAMDRYKTAMLALIPVNIKYKLTFRTSGR